jgi:hypothetical protein
LLARFYVYVLVAANEIDTAALTHVGRLNNKRFVFLLPNLNFEVIQVGRQLPGFWEKIVFLLVLPCHPRQVLSKVVLARKQLDVGRGVDALIGF